MKENYQNEDQQQDSVSEARTQLMNTYLQFRSNLPAPGHIQENKTTQEIQDELRPMLFVSEEHIVVHMLEHDYSMMTEPDGTVKWAIWRQA